MVRAGEYRHQVTIQQRSADQDAAGEQLHTWTTFATRRAAIQRTTGREVFVAAADQARVPTIFRLRWLDGVTTAMRLVWGTKVYDITSAIPADDGRKEEMIIVALELVGAAP